MGCKTYVVDSNVATLTFTRNTIFFHLFISENLSTRPNNDKESTMASGAPGGNFRTWTPTPPERGSFPLDHDGECTEQMMKYLKCMKFTENKNAPNCRILAKDYLKCRMDNQLMEQSEWDSLGLVNLPGDKEHHHKLDSSEEKPKSTK